MSHKRVRGGLPGLSVSQGALAEVDTTANGFSGLQRGQAVGFVCAKGGLCDGG